MSGNHRELRRLPHRLEPRHSTPQEPHENLSEWGFTSPESTISVTGVNRYQGSSSSSTNIVYETDPSSAYHTARSRSTVTSTSTPFHSLTPIPEGLKPNYYSSTGKTPSGLSHHGESRSVDPMPPRTFNNVNVAPRRGRGGQGQRVPPVENLFDVFDNHPRFQQGVIACDLFVQDRYRKNYGRPQCKHTRESRGRIYNQFFGRGGIKDNDAKVTLDPFSRASPSPLRPPWSPSCSSTSSSSSDGRHSWF